MPPESVSGQTLDGRMIDVAVEKLIWRPGVYAFIFNAKQQVLALYNTYSQKLDFPGGGIEIWEGIEPALQREVWEETGLAIQLERLVTVQDNFFVTPSGKHWHTIGIFYRAHAPDASTLRSTILDDEYSVDPRWLDPRTIRAADLTIPKGWHALQQAIEE